jgi:heme a synthase
MNKVETATKGFFKLCLTTLVAVYFLIAVGGVVRATGSGMGCPDWPKCFGQWVPPTSIEQLPKDYKETYSALREKKNHRFIKYLKSFGMTDTAEQIAADQTISVEADFNVVKTWIEYLNRLLGVVIGLLIAFLFWKSIKYIKSEPKLFWYSLATLIGVIFQGWFGSIVVSTNLTTWTVTVHMFIALLIAGFLIYLAYRSNTKMSAINAPFSATWVLVVCAIILLIQVFLGTQVREAIDRVLASPRASWISLLGFEFMAHRSFSWIVLIFHGILIRQLFKTTGAKVLTSALMTLILCSFFTGIGMAYFNVPAFLQPLHLLLATVCFGLQLLLFFRLNSSRDSVLVN